MKFLLFILLLILISCNKEIRVVDCEKHGDYWIGIDKEENVPIICKSKKKNSLNYGGLNEKQI